jgi:hypothetical protein
MFDRLNPQQQAQLIDIAQRSFGNQKLGNAQRAKDALMQYPDFAARIADQHGIAPLPPQGGNGNHDNSMHEFQVDNAVYNSLRDGGGQDDADVSAPMPRPRPAGSNGASRSRSQSSNPVDTAPSEGGREARASAANRDMNSRDGGFHREATNGGGASNAVPEGGDAIGMAGKVAAGVGSAAAAYGAYRYAKSRGGQRDTTSPEAGDGNARAGVADSKPGTDVATRRPVYEGTIEPDAPKSSVDRMIGNTIDDNAPQVPQQRALPPSQKQLNGPDAYEQPDPQYDERWSDNVGQDIHGRPLKADPSRPGWPTGTQSWADSTGGPTPDETIRQLRGPSRARQYPTPMDGATPDDLATLADVMRHGTPQPSNEGVASTIMRGAGRPRARLRVPGR